MKSPIVSGIRKPDGHPAASPADRSEVPPEDHTISNDLAERSSAQVQWDAARIRFVSSDGAGVSPPLAACGILAFKGPPIVVAGVPEWTVRPDTKGFLVIEEAPRIAPIAVARLTPNAVAILHIDATPGAIHELPAVVDQDFILDQPGDLQVKLVISSRDLSLFTASPEDPRVFGQSAWADKVSVWMHSLEPADRVVVAAWNVVTIDSSQGKVSVALPVGDYWINPFEITFGLVYQSVCNFSAYPKKSYLRGSSPEGEARAGR